MANEDLLKENGIEISQTYDEFLNVCKVFKNKDYAIEFLKFMSRTDELNRPADVKGMPSVAIKSEGEKFEDALNPKEFTE